MSTQNQEDLNAIQQTALDYIEGWYDCDEKRTTKALHPDLAKRFFDKGTLHKIGTQDMLHFIRGGGGSNFKGDRQIKVTILDVFNNIAAVRIDSAEYIDYAHFVKIDGKWVILNVISGSKNM